MEIHLEYMAREHFPRPDGWTVVGRVGHQALAYDPDRRPHLLTDVGSHLLDRDEVNRALAPAVDAAALKLWPNGWVVAFSEVFGVNRRALAMDRIARQGLPPGVLLALAELSTSSDADATGWFLMALARFVDQHPDGKGSDLQQRVEDGLLRAREAADGLLLARQGKNAIKDRGLKPSRDDTFR